MGGYNEILSKFDLEMFTEEEEEEENDLDGPNEEA